MGDRIGPGAGDLSRSSQLPRSIQPGHSSLSRRNGYRQIGSDALRLGVKAVNARIGWQVKLYEPLYSMCRA